MVADESLTKYVSFKTGFVVDKKEKKRVVRQESEGEKKET